MAFMKNLFTTSKRKSRKDEFLKELDLVYQCSSKTPQPPQIPYDTRRESHHRRYTPDEDTEHSDFVNSYAYTPRTPRSPRSTHKRRRTEFDYDSDESCSSAGNIEPRLSYSELQKQNQKLQSRLFHAEQRIQYFNKWKAQAEKTVMLCQRETEDSRSELEKAREEIQLLKSQLTLRDSYRVPFFMMNSEASSSSMFSNNQCPSYPLATQSTSVSMASEDPFSGPDEVRCFRTRRYDEDSEELDTSDPLSDSLSDTLSSFGMFTNSPKR